MKFMLNLKLETKINAKFANRLQCAVQFDVRMFMFRCVLGQQKNVDTMYMNFRLFSMYSLDIGHPKMECARGKMAKAAAPKPQVYNSFSQFQSEIDCESLIAFYNEFFSPTTFFSFSLSAAVVVLFVVRFFRGS